METIKQKIEGQSSKDTEVVLAVQIVTEEEYIELFGAGAGSNDETFYGDWSGIQLEIAEQTREAQIPGEDSTEADKPEAMSVRGCSAAEWEGINEGEESDWRTASYII